jgi:hypothetical protein
LNWLKQTRQIQKTINKESYNFMDVPEFFTDRRDRPNNRGNPNIQSLTPEAYSVNIARSLENGKKVFDKHKEVWDKAG